MFEVELDKFYDKDPSGLVIGIIESDNLQTNHNNLKSSSFSLGGKGYDYKYNVEEVVSYKFELNSKIKIIVNNSDANYYVNNELVGKAKLDGNKSYIFGIWSFYLENEVKIRNIRLKQTEKKSK